MHDVSLRDPRVSGFQCRDLSLTNSKLRSRPELYDKRQLIKSKSMSTDQEGQKALYPSMSERLTDKVFIATINGDSKIIRNEFCDLSKVGLAGPAMDYQQGIFGGIDGEFQILTHMRRLEFHAKNAGLLKGDFAPNAPTLPFRAEELVEIGKTVKKMNKDTYGIEFRYLRPRIFRDNSYYGVNPPHGNRAFSVMMQAAPLYSYYGADDGVSLIIIPTTLKLRMGEASQHTWSKGASATYTTGAVVKDYAERNGYTDGLVLYPNSQLGYRIADTSASNFGVIKGNNFYIPKSQRRFLFGITQQVCIHLAKRYGMNPIFADISESDLEGADCWVVFGTAAGVLPVVKIKTENKVLEASNTKMFKVMFDMFQEAKLSGEQFDIKYLF